MGVKKYKVLNDEYANKFNDAHTMWIAASRAYNIASKFNADQAVLESLAKLRKVVMANKVKSQISVSKEFKMYKTNLMRMPKDGWYIVKTVSTDGKEMFHTEPLTSEGIGIISSYAGKHIPMETYLSLIKKFRDPMLLNSHISSIDTLASKFLEPYSDRIFGGDVSSGDCISNCNARGVECRGFFITTHAIERYMERIACDYTMDAMTIANSIIDIINGSALISIAEKMYYVNPEELSIIVVSDGNVVKTVYRKEYGADVANHHKQLAKDLKATIDICDAIAAQEERIKEGRENNAKKVEDILVRIEAIQAHIKALNDEIEKINKPIADMEEKLLSLRASESAYKNMLINHE